MTSGNGDRKSELEIIRQLLIATANRAESTDERLDRLVQSQQITQNQLDRLEQRQDRTQQQIDSNTQAIAQLREAQETTDAQVGVLVTAIDTLAVRVDRIVDYLENQSGNGRGGTGGQPQP